MIQSPSRISLFVRDARRSRTFYPDVLKIPMRMGSSDHDVLLTSDGLHIYLHWTPPGIEVAFQHRGVELFFRVHDVERRTTPEANGGRDSGGTP